MDELKKAKITEEATKAADRFVWLNEACPYPFESPEGQLFKEVFRQARNLNLWNEAIKPRKD